MRSFITIEMYYMFCEGLTCMLLQFYSLKVYNIFSWCSLYSPSALYVATGLEDNLHVHVCDLYQYSMNMYIIYRTAKVMHYLVDKYGGHGLVNCSSSVTVLA